MARRRGGRFGRAVFWTLVALLVFLVVPIIFFQLYFSFHQWTVYIGEWWQAEFVGLEIFRGVFADTRFYLSFLRSLVFAGGSTALTLLLGFALALLMSKDFPGRSLFYLAFITPMLMVPVVIAYDFEMLLVQQGPLNQLLSWLTGHTIQVPWLAKSVPAFLSIMLIEVWNWTPFVFIILLAGFTSLPREPIEAARVLGASRWQIFWEIQLPLLRPVLVLAGILRFLEALGEYAKVWTLTKGGPGTFTETLPVYLYITSWTHFNVSKGAAMSYIALLVIGAIVYVSMRVLLRQQRALKTLLRTS